jgi:hypothetical protein
MSVDPLPDRHTLTGRSQDRLVLFDTFWRIPMNRFLTVLLLSTALTAPAFAQDTPQDIACKDFLAMNQTDQMSAMTDAMSSSMKAADGAMATDDATAADGAMATDGAATDGAMATDDAMAADGAMATDDAMASQESMASMVKMCTENPDMMVMDAMHSMN